MLCPRKWRFVVLSSGLPYGQAGKYLAGLLFANEPARHVVGRVADFHGPVHGLRPVPGRVEVLHLFSFLARPRIFPFLFSLRFPQYDVLPYPVGHLPPALFQPFVLMP
jgi:hypothetical protein